MFLRLCPRHIPLLPSITTHGHRTKREGAPCGLSLMMALLCLLQNKLEMVHVHVHIETNTGHRSTGFFCQFLEGGQDSAKNRMISIPVCVGGAKEGNQRGTKQGKRQRKRNRVTAAVVQNLNDWVRFSPCMCVPVCGWRHSGADQSWDQSVESES